MELERDRIVKITRAIVRLKHSLAADEEINELLSSRLEEFERSLQSGELKTLDVPSMEDAV